MPSKVAMDSSIEIGQYIFRNQIQFAEIHTSWSNVTDKAAIGIPNIKKQLERVLKVGDPVVIKLGYDGDLQEEFTGYVSEIMPKIPMEIKCEDEMWQLKQQTVNKSWSSVTLKEVFEYLYPDNKLKVPDLKLTNFRLSRISKAKALELLKDKFLLAIYFRGKTLHAGLPYFEGDLGEVVYHFQKNAIADELVFKRKEEVKLKVNAISILPNNQKIEVPLGDEFGDETTLHFYNLSKEELIVQANNKLNDMKYDGYRGSFKAFGIPKVTHTMTAELIDGKYPERAGRVFIDSVKTEYGLNTGFRRTIVPGRNAGTN